MSSKKETEQPAIAMKTTISQKVNFYITIHPCQFLLSMAVEESHQQPVEDIDSVYIKVK